jgi:uncharacterized repeat protein (TIGR03803 family)
VLTVSSALAEPPARATRFRVVHNFNGPPADGTMPTSDLIGDGMGNLYGTTQSGGANTGSCAPFGCGTIFKVDRAGNETVLHSFTGTDGDIPTGGLTRDSVGNLYGTTYFGGGGGQGTVFKLDNADNLTVLYNFDGGTDGRNPDGLVLDGQGNLYGITLMGGMPAKSGCLDNSLGCGVVFKLDPAGNETIMHTFTGGADGGAPTGKLVRDSAGNLFGVTFYGGTGYGVVFKVDRAGTETVLYTFQGGATGAYPISLIRDRAGNLHGTADGGVVSGACDGSGCGVIFKVDAAGGETVIHSFTGGAGGWSPSSVIRDPAGSFFGTATLGGSTGYGVVFKVGPSGRETVIHTFEGGADSLEPAGGVIRDSAGHLFGTASGGNTENSACTTPGMCGVVFEITP